MELVSIIAYSAEFPAISDINMQHVAAENPLYS